MRFYQPPHGLRDYCGNDPNTTPQRTSQQVRDGWTQTKLVRTRPNTTTAQTLAHLEVRLQIQKGTQHRHDKPLPIQPQWKGGIRVSCKPHPPAPLSASQESNRSCCKSVQLRT